MERSVTTSFYKCLNNSKYFEYSLILYIYPFPFFKKREYVYVDYVYKVLINKKRQKNLFNFQFIFIMPNINFT